MVVRRRSDASVRLGGGGQGEAIRVLKMLDLLTTSHRVRRERILAQFRPRQHPPETGT